MPDTCYECGGLYVNVHKCPVVIEQITLREKALTALEKAPEIKTRQKMADAISKEISELKDRLENPR